MVLVFLYKYTYAPEQTKLLWCVFRVDHHAVIAKHDRNIALMWCSKYCYRSDPIPEKDNASSSQVSI